MLKRPDTATSDVRAVTMTIGSGELSELVFARLLDYGDCEDPPK